MPSALIVAGGSGVRFGSKKQFLPLQGTPVLRRTADVFAAHPAIGHLTVAVPDEDIPHTREILTGLPIPLTITAGGATRQESVYRGLLATPAEDPVVLVHDGVRPLITAEIITRIIEGLGDCPGCIPALPMTDTLKQIRDGRVVRTVDRSSLFRVQTPQAFDRATLINAHETGVSGATDDSALLEALGHEVRIVPGDPTNLKITIPEDITLAEAILSCRTV